MILSGLSTGKARSGSGWLLVYLFEARTFPSGVAQDISGVTRWKIYNLWCLTVVHLQQSNLSFMSFCLGINFTFDPRQRRQDVIARIFGWDTWYYLRTGCVCRKEPKVTYKPTFRTLESILSRSREGSLEKKITTDRVGVRSPTGRSLWSSGLENEMVTIVVAG